MKSDTSTLTLELPSQDVTFAKAYAKAHGLSVSEMIHRYLRRMRALEAYSPGTQLDAITGLLPADLDAEWAFRDHLTGKHTR